MHLQDLATGLTVATVGAASLLVLLARPRAAVGAAILFLAVYVSSANFALHYAIWILPFLILAGWTAGAALSQVALLVPVLVVYLPALEHTFATPRSPWGTGLADYLYVPWMDGLWVAALAALLAISLRAWRARPRRPRVASAQ
jgi:hypothetical protein